MVSICSNNYPYETTGRMDKNIFKRKGARVHLKPGKNFVVRNRTQMTQLSLVLGKETADLNGNNATQTTPFYYTEYTPNLKRDTRAQIVSLFS